MWFAIILLFLCIALLCTLLVLVIVNHNYFKSYIDYIVEYYLEVQ
jgi:hypothetical protein